MIVLWIVLGFITMMALLAVLLKPASVYHNKPEEKNPMEGKKVRFVEDAAEKENADGVNYDGYLRDYCRLNGITIQPWSPLQYGMFMGPFMQCEDYAKLNALRACDHRRFGIQYQRQHCPCRHRAI